jgi:cation diffusion facilitator family transporter
MGNERRVRIVAALTFFTMIIEVVVGHLSGSMALLADGWHMATHAAAMFLAVSTYWLARKLEDNPDFSFGAGKAFALGGYTSALMLAGVGLWMAIESVQRFTHGRAIDYDDALPVAVFGLLVNIISAKLLGDHDHPGDHAHEHGHEDHGHEHHHHDDHSHDQTLRSAYLHVLADVLTSVLAIVALVVGKLWGAAWVDPAVGVLGALMVLRWAGGLLLSSGRQLLDAVPSGHLDQEIRTRLETIDDVVVTDLHVWTLAPQRVACIVALVTSTPREAQHYKQAILELGDFSHVTVEVHHCTVGHAA